MFSRACLNTLSSPLYTLNSLGQSWTGACPQWKHWAYLLGISGSPQLQPPEMGDSVFRTFSVSLGLLRTGEGVGEGNQRT